MRTSRIRIHGIRWGLLALMAMVVAVLPGGGAAAGEGSRAVGTEVSRELEALAFDPFTLEAAGRPALAAGECRPIAVRFETPDFAPVLVPMTPPMASPFRP